MKTLNVCSELQDCPIVAGKPCCVIPWVVMQELDALKDGKKKVTALESNQTVSLIRSVLWYNEIGYQISSGL